MGSRVTAALIVAVPTLTGAISTEFTVIAGYIAG
jgi:Flp pilus assembly pilin Flp